MGRNLSPPPSGKGQLPIIPANLNFSSSYMLVACEQPTNICSGPTSPSRYVTTTMDARSQEPIGLVQPRCAPCSVQPPACLLERALFAAIVTTQSSSPTGTFPMLRILSPPAVDDRLRCSCRHKHGGTGYGWQLYLTAYPNPPPQHGQAMRPCATLKFMQPPAPG